MGLYVSSFPSKIYFSLNSILPGLPFLPKIIPAFINLSSLLSETTLYGFLFCFFASMFSNSCKRVKRCSGLSDENPDE